MPDFNDARRLFVAIDDCGREVTLVLSRNPSPDHMVRILKKYGRLVEQVIASAPREISEKLSVERDLAIKALANNTSCDGHVQAISGLMEQYKSILWSGIRRDNDARQANT